TKYVVYYEQDSQVLRAVALPRRSLRYCDLGSGVPKKTRFRRCRRTKPMIPRRPAVSAKAETPGSDAETGPRGVESTHVSVSSVVVEPVGALDPILAAGNVELLQFLEVGHASHHVVAFGRMAGLQLLERPLGLLLVLHQVFHGIPHGVHPRVGRVERDEDELVAEITQLAEQERVRVAAPAERGRVVEGEREMRVGLPHGLGEGDGGLAPRVREF